MVAKSLVKVNFLSPGVEWERALSNNVTLNVSAALTPTFIYASNLEGSNLKIRAIPIADIQFRYYYNLKTCKEVGKSIYGNPGNFLALHAGAYGSDFVSDAAQQITANVGLVWGAQRTYINGFNLSGFVGPGIQIDSNGKPRFTIISGLRVGWLYNKKRLKQEAAVKKLMLNE